MIREKQKERKVKRGHRMIDEIQKTANAWSKLGNNYANSNVHQFGPSLPKLIALARPNANDICLDIGTGTGHTAAQLAQYAKKVYGLDPADGMRKAAQETYGHLENLEFIAGTSEQTGFPDNTFDIVTARHTLHHHPSMPRPLTEIKRVLKPGGRLVIVDEITPNENVNTWYHALEVTRDPTHLRAYFVSEWQNFIRDAGLIWVVGDINTVYTLEVESWITRMKPTPAQAENVRFLFREASLEAKEIFNIHYKDRNATTFDMPMLVALIVKLA
jgi:ubiquinone/menaquinone biosynthesis C-methylase UbiE